MDTNTYLVSPEVKELLDLSEERRILGRRSSYLNETRTALFSPTQQNKERCLPNGEPMPVNMLIAIGEYFDEPEAMSIGGEPFDFAQIIENI